MSTLTITRGLPASGKSTWAKAWVAEDPTKRARVNRDDLRAMLFETPTYEFEQEQKVTEAARANVSALLSIGLDVVADDTNLRPSYVREWARFAAANGVEFEVVEFPIHPDEAVARDALRPKPVGEDVIRNMVSRYLKKGQLQVVPDEYFDIPPEVAPYKPPVDGIPAIIVDIDGTVAVNDGHRGWYDLEKVIDDKPHTPVIEAVRAAHAAGLTVVYCSGREDTCREDTALWIREHVKVDGPLFMRAADDKRKDSVVKRELFDSHIRFVYDVRWVYDDRDQVVNMWRSLGLTCMQVAPGDF